MLTRAEWLAALDRVSRDPALEPRHRRHARSAARADPKAAIASLFTRAGVAFTPRPGRHAEAVMTPFEKRITARPEDIDELGHVNNAAWVRWIQDMATAHWHAVAPPDHVDAYVWVVIRHEIDYLRAVGPARR